MNVPLWLAVLSALCLKVRGQIQYYENNTIKVPIWHFFKTTKVAWQNFTRPSTLPQWNWIEWHTRQSIQVDLFKNMSSTTARTLKPTTPYPLFSIGTDRIFNLSLEAVQLKAQEDYEYEQGNNMSLITEPDIVNNETYPSPRIFNVYKGIYVTDPAVVDLFWNQSYYDKYNRSIYWAMKKAYWKKTPTTPSTEWELINVTKIGDWERMSADVEDLSYWDSERRRDEYSHHDYMEAIQRLNQTPTTEQHTPLIKLLANTRIASMWKLHSILPYINIKTTMPEFDTAEERDLVYTFSNEVSPVLEMGYESKPKEYGGTSSDYFGQPDEYDPHDYSEDFGSKALRAGDATKNWDSRYYRQQYPKDMQTRFLQMPTSPDPWEEWQNMDTWKRREYILKGWNTLRPDCEETRATPMIHTPDPNPTTFDYYDYFEYTPLVDYFKDDEITTRINSMEVSNIIWSEKQYALTTQRTTDPAQTQARRQKKRKVWTTAKPAKAQKRKMNRTMSQGEIKKMMKAKYDKLNAKKEAEKKRIKNVEEIDERFRGFDEEFATPDPELGYTTEKSTLFNVDNYLTKGTALPKTVEPLKEFQCHICLKELSSKGGYVRHMNTHKRLGQWMDKVL